MTDVPPGPPPGPRDPADGWVELPDGRKFWGKAGAAGLLAVDSAGVVLLQHRIAWSHFGGTWGLPGGARHLGESALEGAFREAHEETGIDVSVLRPRFAVRLDLGVWTYTTVVATAPVDLHVAVSDRESTALEWVAGGLVSDRELHPGFGAAWPRLQELLREPDPVVIVDGANVVGSRPDGWWKDRPGAASRLLEQLAALAVAGMPAEGGEGELPIVHRWPEIRVVLEGQAKSAEDVAGVAVVRAAGEGDDTIVAEVAAAIAEGRPATAVTADRGLADRVQAAGGDVRGPGWLLTLLR